ncbi:MAG: hypothetical protein L3K25_06090 [Gammaproteobacteria bacterium]|nr:hypothetical protein [Gammaproteobacteria bacterium]MCF6337206.1 hypothetical protein [Gammaproteobacteria bacterium]
MDDSGPESMWLKKAVIALVSGGIIGYFLRGKIDLYNKKKNISFKDLKKAADAMQPVISEYISLSAKLDEDTGITLDICIDTYKKNVGRLVDLKNQLDGLSRQNKHYFSISTANDIEEMNSHLSDQLKKLANNFDAADQFREDGTDEVHRIMKEGIDQYCNTFEQETHLIMNTVKEGIRQSIA